MCTYTRHSVYYTWMTYGYRSLYSDLPSYNSCYFLKPMQLSCWVPKTFIRQKYLTKYLYFVKKKFSQDQQKFVYYQNVIHDFQAKNHFANKKNSYPKNEYYHAIINERSLKSHYSYIDTTEMAKERDIFFNSEALNHKHLYPELR